MTTKRQVRRALASVAILSVSAALAACGSDGGSGSDGSGSDGEVSGELRTFTYSDTVHESKLVNFKKNYPDVEVRTATFESNDEAAAKIKAGFRSDIIEVCLDEQGPLVDAGMLAPIDITKLENWDDLDPTFRDAAGVASGESGDITMVPTQAGAVGLIYDMEEFPDGVDSWADLFDPAYAGRVALDGGYWLTPFAIMALANGSTDPMTQDDEEVAESRDALIDLRDAGHFRAFARSDADMGNMFKSGEIVISDGGRGHRAGHRQGWRQRRLGGSRGGRPLLGVRAEHQLARRRTSTRRTPSSTTTPRPRRRRSSATTAS